MKTTELLSRHRIHKYEKGNPPKWLAVEAGRQAPVLPEAETEAEAEGLKFCHCLLG